MLWVKFYAILKVSLRGLVQLEFEVTQSQIVVDLCVRIINFITLEVALFRLLVPASFEQANPREKECLKALLLQLLRVGVDLLFKFVPQLSLHKLETSLFKK